MSLTNADAELDVEKINVELSQASVSGGSPLVAITSPSEEINAPLPAGQTRYVNFLITGTTKSIYSSRYEPMGRVVLKKSTAGQKRDARNRNCFTGGIKKTTFLVVNKTVL